MKKLEELAEDLCRFIMMVEKAVFVQLSGKTFQHTRNGGSWGWSCCILAWWERDSRASCM